MKECNLIVLTFLVTAKYDMLLRELSLNYEKLPKIIKNNFLFIGYLTPYFKEHTLLSAALLAGFIGATTQLIIINIMDFPNKKNDINYYLLFLLLTFIVSALYGFLMKWSKLFPHLDKTYYRDLGLIRSLYHDGISGLIVQVTVIVIMLIKNRNK